LGNGVNVRVGVDVAGAARVAPNVGVVEAVPGGNVRVARRGVAVDVDVALGVAVDEGVRVALGVGIKVGVVVVSGVGTSVALGEGSGEAVAVAARVGNDTGLDSGVTG